MSTTWGQLKTKLKSKIWPKGEPSELVTQHNDDFVSAIIDLQQFVPCLQVEHTDLFPACATYFRCGLTYFQAPRGNIKRLSVLVNGEWCNALEYTQICPQYIEQWLAMYYKSPISFSSFFSLSPLLCWKPSYPTPTDVGVTAGLPELPLGFHYPQGSTDRTRRLHGRLGVWAIERGKIWVAPWINVETTPDTIAVMWDGIKRVWSDNDPVDDDPLLAQALEEYARSEHLKNYGRDYEGAQIAGEAYQNARALLIRQCIEENRVRDREASWARSSAESIAAATLYFNDTAGTYTATCPSGQTGSPVTVTVPVGTVSSTLSVADANAQAKAQAQQQAQSQLQCVSGQGGQGGGGTGGTTTYWNTLQPNVVVSCSTDDPNAPAPTGQSVTLPVPAGIASGTTQEEANQNAIAYVTQQAMAKLVCTWSNSAQTAVITCLDSSTRTSTVAAGQFTSTVSQSDANNQAKSKATSDANSLCATGNQPNNQVSSTYSRVVNIRGTDGRPFRCTVQVTMTVPAGYFYGNTVQEATAYAQNVADQAAISQAANLAAAGQCGVYTYTIPIPP